MKNTLTLQHLDILIDVVELGTFSAAAEKARLSQPAVSQQIQQLERYFGARLVERCGRKVQPTDVGRLVLQSAHRIHDELETVQDAVQPFRAGSAGRVRIGTGATACIYLLPPILGDLSRRIPGLECVVRTGNSPDIQRLLEENALDLALVTLPAAGRSLETTPLFTEDLMAIFPAGETPDGPVTAKTLAARPLVLYEDAGHTRLLIDRWFQDSGVTAKPVMELGSVEAIKEMVAAGLGWSVLPASSVAKEQGGGLGAVPLVPRLTRSLGLMVRRDKRLTAGLRQVIGALEKGLRG
ncbi:LysR family transcriptional regulator [Thalassovita mangrovi]|uniref:LysR family transcriptional regulator n=1 Tax=Thalassovita mangrovi TaxID=2692236 RepID=UPI001BB2D576|nr:LysR family transcriptional regulator [Thalassovita mangrovi]